MESYREVERVRRRLDIVLAHLEDEQKSKAAIARDLKTARATVRTWLERFKADGLEGLLSRSSPGRPPEIDQIIREELVRLPRETRPPSDLGDQWTVRTLAQVFGVSPSYVSKVWREAGFDPPEHLQQVEHNPFRMIILDVRLAVPAWYALHLEIAARERELGIDELVRDRLTDGEPFELMHEDRHLYDLRDRWVDQNERLPRVDPRRLDYRLTLKRKAQQHED